MKYTLDITLRINKLFSDGNGKRWILSCLKYGLLFFVFSGRAMAMQQELVAQGFEVPSLELLAYEKVLADDINRHNARCSVQAKFDLVKKGLRRVLKNRFNSFTYTPLQNVYYMQQLISKVASSTLTVEQAYGDLYDMLKRRSTLFPEKKKYKNDYEKARGKLDHIYKHYFRDAGCDVIKQLEQLEKTQLEKTLHYFKESGLQFHKERPSRLGPSYKYYSPMLLAIKDNCYEFVDIMIRLGVPTEFYEVIYDSESKQKVNTTPAVYAIAENRPEILQLILENRDSSIYRPIFFDTNLIGFALGRGSGEALDVLLDHAKKQYTECMEKFSARYGEKDIEGRYKDWLTKGLSNFFPTAYRAKPRKYYFNKYGKILVKIAREIGVDEEVVGSNKTLLQVATKHGYALIVADLLKNNPNLEIKTYRNETPLALAVKRGYASIVSDLLRNNVNLEVKNIHGETPLALAVNQGYGEIVELLLNAYKERDLKISNISEILSNFLDCYLRERNCQICLKRRLKISASHDVCSLHEGNHKKMKRIDKNICTICELLIDAGAEVTSTIDGYFSLLGYVIWYKDYALARFLINKGADVNSRWNEHPLATKAIDKLSIKTTGKPETDQEIAELAELMFKNGLTVNETRMYDIVSLLEAEPVEKRNKYLYEVVKTNTTLLERILSKWDFHSVRALLNWSITNKFKRYTVKGLLAGGAVWCGYAVLKGLCTLPKNFRFSQ